MSNEDSRERPLHRRDLGTDQATALLGVMATQHLSLSGTVCFYLGKDGTICIARAGEVTLDALPEPMAISELVSRGYDDSELEEYLKGRDARMGGA